ncbi:MAG: hypothetical protein ISN26_02360 [Betaproteobacteria bacterium AqS2]|uniref:Uncharacterized protein n=1 Tax=Candidatus Amphirhobacter heronislandensis TaxID=1732024 RepID=A0A930UEF3_9GAMM|nr:hypothetical protein [Betaproteobacteria bacterium AqS2]
MTFWEFIVRMVAFPHYATKRGLRDVMVGANLIALKQVIAREVIDRKITSEGTNVSGPFLPEEREKAMKSTLEYLEERDLLLACRINELSVHVAFISDDEKHENIFQDLGKICRGQGGIHCLSKKKGVYEIVLSSNEDEIPHYLAKDDGKEIALFWVKLLLCFLAYGLIFDGGKQGVVNSLCDFISVTSFYFCLYFIIIQINLPEKSGKSD